MMTLNSISWQSRQSIRHHTPASCSTLFCRKEGSLLLPWPFLLSGHFISTYKGKKTQHATSGHMPKEMKSAYRDTCKPMLALFTIVRICLGGWKSPSICTFSPQAPLASLAYISSIQVEGLKYISSKVTRLISLLNSQAWSQHLHSPQVCSTLLSSLFQNKEMHACQHTTPWLLPLASASSSYITFSPAAHLCPWGLISSYWW